MKETTITAAKKKDGNREVIYQRKGYISENEMKDLLSKATEIGYIDIETTSREV